MFKTDSSSVTGKLTYSTIFQLAADGLNLCPDFGAPQHTIRTKCSSFLQIFVVSPQPARGVDVMIHSCSQLVKIWENPFDVFSPSPSHSGCCQFHHLHGYCVPPPLSSRLKLSAKHSSQWRLHVSAVVPTWLWIHQYMRTTSVWQ